MTARLVAIVACIVLSMTLVAGCARPRATESDCRAIFDRIVAIEVREMGFVDPVFVERTKRDLRHRFRGAIRECVGHTLRADALACARTAQTSEELSHRCLR